MEQILLCNTDKQYLGGVYRILLDPKKGTLSHYKRILLEKEPNDICFDLNNHLFIACRTDQGGGIVSYDNNMSNYQQIDRTFEEPSAPFRLAIQKEWEVLISAHRDGSLYSYTIEQSGNLIREQQVEVEEDIIDCVLTNDNVLIVSLKKEPAFVCYQVSHNGHLKWIGKTTFPFVEAFSHLTFHSKNQYFYALNQEMHHLHVFQYEVGGTITHVHSYRTVPQHQKGMATDMVLWKDRCLFISNRETNTISVFKLENEGHDVTYLNSIACEGIAPITMRLNRQQDYLFVMNAFTNNLSLFKIHSCGHIELCSYDTKVPGTRAMISSEV